MCFVTKPQVSLVLDRDHNKANRFCVFCSKKKILKHFDLREAPFEPQQVCLQPSQKIYLLLVIANQADKLVA